MHNRELQRREMMELIQGIHQRYHFNLQADKRNDQRLLALAEETGSLYGQALAHVYLAQYYQIVQQDKPYFFHLERAREIAQRENFPDVLMECCKLDGFYHIAISDVLAAIHAFLKGAELATRTGDRKSAVIFYNNIAEKYADSGAYHDAEDYYTRALGILRYSAVPNGDYYHKIVLGNLIHLSCLQGNLEKAERYWSEGEHIPCEAGVVSLFFAQGEIRIALLQGDKEKAKSKVDLLIAQLQQQKEDPVFLQPVYLRLMEILLALQEEQYGKWCLQQLFRLYGNAEQSIFLYLHKLRIEYAVLFQKEEDAFYEAFYQSAIEGTLQSQRAMAGNFKSFMSLYEAEKAGGKLLQEQDNLQKLADRDELTRVYNRRYFSKLVSKLIQDGRTSTIGCAMVDLDFFKEYNDTYGHQMGDTILRKIAALLEKYLPEKSYVARYGGDEFICLFADKEEKEIVSFVETVQKALRQICIPHEKAQPYKRVTLSFGIFCTKQGQHRGEMALLEGADSALYEAKKKGRNTYFVHSENASSS